MKREGQQRLQVVPLGWRAACAFIAANHRHHSAPRGQKFAVGVIDESGTIRGVATCGRPVSRALDDGLTLEVNRTCVDGCPNANSMLYGACARIAAAMGYCRIHTDTQDGESGVSLRAAGWSESKKRPPRPNWHDSSRSTKVLRNPDSPGMIARTRWTKTLRGGA